MSNTIELWGVKDPNISAQLALADRLDLFKREAGFEVNCTFIESGTTMVDDLLQAEQKPFAFTQTPLSALRLHEQSFGTKIVAPLADIAGAQQVIVRPSSHITAPNDLLDKQIGIARGAAVYLALKNMAKDCNVDLESARFVDLLPHEQLEAFKEGKLDAIASWEPWTTKALIMGGQFYFSGNRSEIPGLEGDINWLINQSCLIVPDSVLQKQADTLIRILNVFRKANDLLDHHRNKVLQPLADFFELTKVELMFAMQKNHYSMAVTNLFRLGVLGFRDFLIEHGELSSTYTEEELYDLSFLRQVDSSLIFLEDTIQQDFDILEKDGIYYRENFAIETHGPFLKVLLADDSRFVRNALSKAIDRIGGEVIAEAATGSEVIYKFAFMHPDVITIDLSMPGVSGIEAIKILLQIDPNISVIVISGTDLREVREEVFNLGVKMFISKPFDPMKVATLLQSATFTEA